MDPILHRLVISHSEHHHFSIGKPPFFIGKWCFLIGKPPFLNGAFPYSYAELPEGTTVATSYCQKFNGSHVVSFCNTRPWSTLMSVVQVCILGCTLLFNWCTWTMGIKYLRVLCTECTDTTAQWWLWSRRIALNHGNHGNHGAWIAMQPIWVQCWFHHVMMLKKRHHFRPESLMFHASYAPIPSNSIEHTDTECTAELSPLQVYLFLH